MYKSDLDKNHRNHKKLIRAVLYGPIRTRKLKDQVQGVVVREVRVKGMTRWRLLIPKRRGRVKMIEIRKRKSLIK